MSLRTTVSVRFHRTRFLWTILLSFQLLSAQYTPQGTLEPFWRYTAALGGYPDFHSSGQALMEVPDYLCTGNDFAYRKRPFKQEALFGDHLSMVRFLGGFGKRLGASVDELADMDMAYRVVDADSSTRVEYRMDLVEKRMRPYLDAGYTRFTIVLDNIPWGMTADPMEGNLGQTGIPADWDEWADFIERLCRELETVCGPHVTENMRFRAGTEFHGTKRFNGNGDEDYIKYYNASWEGVRRVFPDASFGMYNVAGVSVNGLRKHNMNAFNIPALKSRDAPFDWVSYSHYFLPGEGYKSLIVPFIEVWEEYERLYPSIEFSREIHEFGMQPWVDDKTGMAHLEPGSSGIATTLYTLLGLWNNGLERCWHWSVLDKFIGHKGARLYLPQGNAWIYSVLDKMAGGKSWYLEADNQIDSGTCWTGLYSLKESEAYILLNAYNPDGEVNGYEIAQYLIPKDAASGLDFSGAKAAVANKTTVVHDLTRNDLEEAGLLVPFFKDNPHLCSTISEMAYESDPSHRSGEGMKFVAEKHSQYVSAWNNSLTLRSIGGRGFEVADRGSHYLITIGMSAPESIILRVPRI